MISSNTRATALIELAFIIFAATGCAPASVYPLSDERDSKLDERLLGKWREASKISANGPIDIQVRRKAGSETALEIVYVDPESDKQEEETMQVYATKIGEFDYLTCRDLETRRDAKQQAAAFTILQYRVVGENRVDIYRMDNRSVAEAIDQGELKGQYFGLTARKASCVVISDSSENIRRYLEKHGADCFDRGEELLSFKRSTD